MLFLSPASAESWSEAAREVLEAGGAYGEGGPGERGILRPAFHYHVGSLLAATGAVGQAKEWLSRGAEDEPIPGNSYLLDYIERQGDRLSAPEVTFSDPRPWEHFSGLPELKQPRQHFLERSTASLPAFEHPLRYMDIGCGNGLLSTRLVEMLRGAGKVSEVAEVVLVDPSQAMLELAAQNAGRAFPTARVRVMRDRLEEVSDELPAGFDLAVCVSSVHHMPLEGKGVHLARLGDRVDHFLLYELEGNHDLPELHSPELAFSVYQIFGAAVGYIFGREAPFEVQRDCADHFAMSEAVSLLTEPRGKRTEYHMLRGQWRGLLDEILSPRLECLFDTTCQADRFVEQFAVHYGR